MATARKRVSIAGSQVVENRTVSAAEATAKELTLSATPKDASKVSFSFPNGSDQVNGTDFSVSGDVLSWNGLSLETLIEAGDVITLTYFIK